MSVGIKPVQKDFRSFIGSKFVFLSALVLFCVSAICVSAQSGKPSVIVIPRFIGSELVNEKTKKVVWFRASRSKDDDLRLPLSSDLAANRDNLVPQNIWQKIKIGFQTKNLAYGKLLDALKNRGYREGNWENPAPEDFADTIYVFAYDWRRDNAENAQLLIRKIENLKNRLNRPNLKFNVVAHSMGGLVTRYAAMYADADLQMGRAKPMPTWAGAKHFDKIFLIGTPNEGSVLALKSLVSGFAPGGIDVNLPFIQNLTVYDFFTIPSIFQLLPTDGTLRVFDENLRPMQMDIYDVKTWETYGWSVIDKRDFAGQFKIADRNNARSYFLSVLNRAKRFHEALNATSDARIPVSLYAVGADCKETLDGVIIYRSGNDWKTNFTAKSFRRSDGRRVSSADLKKLLFAPGDGIVSKNSLLGDRLIKNGFRPIFSAAADYFQCEGHNNLVANSVILNRVFNLLAQKN